MSERKKETAHERAVTNTRDLDELLAWLEYGRTSGHKAARCDEAQEHHWADLLRVLMQDAKEGKEAERRAKQCG